MGRGKVELKRIEDKSNRQVTFSKRRGGMMKKARELSVLCDVEVALFIFSASGRLYEFCSGDSLKKIIERYQTYATKEGAIYKCVDEPKKHHADCTCLCQGTNQLHLVQRHLEGNNIEHLNLTELIQLENQLDAVLKQTRSRKTELMLEAVTALYEKERQLREENDTMEREIAADDSRSNQGGDLELELNNATATTSNNYHPSFNWL